MSGALDPLQRLVDKDAIRDVLLRYARGIDRLDVELFRTVFWDDGGFEDGIVEGPASDFVPQLVGDAVRGMFAATQHFISNERIEFEDAEHASVESCFLAYHLLNPGRDNLNAMLGEQRMRELGADYERPYELYVGGRYLDRFEKRSGSWRILRRRFVFDWTSAAPDGGLHHEGLARLCKLQPARDRSDPSYRR